MRPLFAIATLSMLAAPAYAGSVFVEVMDTAGHPLPDTVVTLSPHGGTSVRQAAAETHYFDAADATSIPHVTALRAGDSVVYRNSDSVSHRVTSSSPLASFDHVLAPGECSAPHVFERPGSVAFGWQGRGQAEAYLYVTSAPAMVVTDAGGRARIDDLAIGPYTARAWHPRLRPGITLPIQGVEVIGTEPATVRFVLALLGDAQE